jgi:nitrate reductase beta subunit
VRYGFVIDHNRCIGCHACTVACKDEHSVPVGVFRTWVKYIEKGQFPNASRHFGVMRCNHCDAAPCVEICPTSALFRRDDGIVDFDNSRALVASPVCRRALTTLYTSIPTLTPQQNVTSAPIVSNFSWNPHAWLYARPKRLLQVI